MLSAIAAHNERDALTLHAALIRIMSGGVGSGDQAETYGVLGIHTVGDIVSNSNGIWRNDGLIVQPTKPGGGAGGGGLDDASVVSALTQSSSSGREEETDHLGGLSAPLSSTVHDRLVHNRRLVAIRESAAELEERNRLSRLTWSRDSNGDTVVVIPIEVEVRANRKVAGSVRF